MAVRADQYAKRTLDFVERLQALTDYKAICQCISRELEWFGFTCVSDLTIPGPGKSLEATIHMNTRPREYVDRYVEQNYVVRDPVVTELRSTVSPYSWSDIRDRRRLSKPDERIMDEASEFDVRDGLIIPIVTLSGSVSIFSPCGPAPDLSQRARSALEIIGIYSHQALQRALVRTSRDETPHKPLTPREREVMLWVAAGKTDDEIAEILSIGTSTVTAHVESAKLKLDAFKRTFAIVQAIRFGEISL